MNRNFLFTGLLSISFIGSNLPTYAAEEKPLTDDDIYLAGCHFDVPVPKTETECRELASEARDLAAYNEDLARYYFDQAAELGAPTQEEGRREKECALAEGDYVN